MKKQSLNGTWLYRVGKGKWKPQPVPFSTLPVGSSECKRSFVCNEKAQTTFLQFEGITYFAKVYLNEEFLGEMLPYSEYSFDISQKLLPNENLLRVEIEDIAPDFGPSEGWENFGGIIRNVSLLYADIGYIKDVFFHSSLSNEYRDAEFTVETEADCPQDCYYEISLKYREETVYSYTQNVAESACSQKLENIVLWSVEAPNLYTLSVTLKQQNKELDFYQCQVGFREIKCDRHRFIINGKPAFLRGVCKHEMIGSSGHVVSPKAIEQDLLRIKKTGCNFVRLVHYPHCKETLEIADRIGLMVSEEPGLWWSDTSNPAISQGSLEVLKRVILRDRNHPCIAFWLCFNECVFTEQFLIDSANTCRKYDPTRLVSGANCMSDEDTLKYYNICNFDFYTMHPYAQTFDRAATSAKILHDKPLLFTEYGGYYLYDNPHLLRDFIFEMTKLYQANSDEGALAGAFFWFWAGINDFNRGKPACIDGALTEGLLDADQTPTMIFQTFCTAWDEAQRIPSPTSLYYYKALDTLQHKKALPALNTGASFETLIPLTKEKFPANRVKMRRRRIQVGPCLQQEEIPGIACTPYVIADENCVEFLCESSTKNITILGMTSLFKGYPIAGEYGEVAAEVIITLKDGSKKRISLRNGIEFTTAMTTLSSSRIDPIAEVATPFARFGYEKNFENYIMNRFDLDLGEVLNIQKISVCSANRGYHLLIYGILI